MKPDEAALEDAMEQKKVTRRRNLFGYCDRLTARPGDTVSFKVSAYDEVAYDATLVRIINGDAVSGAGDYREIVVDAPFAGRHEGRFQATNIGSCAMVGATGALDLLQSFTVQSYVFPTTPHKGEQHLVSRWSDTGQHGWALIIDANGCPAFLAGEGRERTAITALSRPLLARRWVLLSASVDLEERSITLAQRPAEDCGFDAAPEPESVSAPIDPSMLPQSGPLLFAASRRESGDRKARQTVHLFNGRLDSMRLAKAAWSPAQVEAAAGPRIEDDTSRDLVGWWDCSAGIGTDRITDRSGHGLHARTVNLPLRAVRGVHWDGTCHDWRQNPEHYGAIHFHDDDLYDCAWQSDFTYEVPPDLRSGIYAARLRSETGAEEYITFFVAAPKERPGAKLAVLLPTFTYLAYANESFDSSELPPGGEEAHAQLVEDPFYYDEVRAYPELGRSLYQHHSDGSPIHLSSWLRPILNLEPKSNLFGLCADTLITAWLEHRGIDYDILTDDLVHEEGVGSLSPYRVVMSGNHPEYATTRLQDAVQSYLEGGGRYMYMGGNGFYWRVDRRHDLPEAIEVRRARSGSAVWFSEVGEYHHEFSGDLGGIWRDLGRAPQRLLGIGFIAQGFAGSTWYRRSADADEARAAFIFAGVDDEVIGDFGLLGGGAAGEEIDAASYDLGTPGHALVVARSENHNSAMLMVREETVSSRPIEWARDRVHADVVFFETPAGGAVFSTGSMAWVGSLSHNDYENNVEHLTMNVLRRFLDDSAFVYPGRARAGPRDGYSALKTVRVAP